MRFAHLLSGEPAAAQAAATPTPIARESRDETVARLQASVDSLEANVAELRRQFAEFKKQFE